MPAIAKLIASKAAIFGVTAVVGVGGAGVAAASTGLVSTSSTTVASPAATSTDTAIASPTDTATSAPTATDTASATPTDTASATSSPTDTATGTPTSTATDSPTDAPDPSETAEPSGKPSITGYQLGMANKAAHAPAEAHGGNPNANSHATSNPGNTLENQKHYVPAPPVLAAPVSPAAVPAGGQHGEAAAHGH